jgi:tetratricopeptide (TPR) repeat protein
MGVTIGFQKNILIRLGFTVAALAMLAGNSYYYSQLLIRHQEAVRMGTLTEALEAKTTKKLKPATQRYMQGVYGPHAAKARESFLDRISYWKNIHKYYYLAAVSYLREGKTNQALKSLGRSLEYHPFFLNSYRLLGYVYDSLNLDGRAEACEKVCKGILSGEIASPDVVCNCIRLEGFAE